jgi:hypothetical protein
MQAYFALIDDIRHRNAEIFIMLFFLIFFAQNAHFFLMLGIDFLYARCETKCFGETKKSFIIL